MDDELKDFADIGDDAVGNSGLGGDSSEEDEIPASLGDDDDDDLGDDDE